ncbi:MAG: metallophosphoesterase [Terracidiphilus sp.]
MSPTLSQPVSQTPITRRRFLQAGTLGVATLALYPSEIERHWLEITRRDVVLPGLSHVFDGMRIAQISDIHMDVFTEPLFLRHVIDEVNRLQPDAVLLTGDYVTEKFVPNRYSSKKFIAHEEKFAIGAAWQCANMLRDLKCRSIYAILGNHDHSIGADQVSEALADNGITMLTNACLPIERNGNRFWLAGLDDPVLGNPNADLAIPPSIRNLASEPVVLMCHAPDYVDTLLTHPASKTVALMLSGHTHGGQVRLPLIGFLHLPELGKKYVEGWFRFGGLQLHVNRGIGTLGLPIRFNCPPELTVVTLRTA